MNWLKYKTLYFIFSGILIISSIYALINWGLKLSIDFTGGVILEYQVGGLVDTDEVSSNLAEVGVKVDSIQKSEQGYLVKAANLSKEDRDIIKTTLDGLVGSEISELRVETVGPTIGPELVKKTVYAIAIAAIAILIWVAVQFRSIKYGTSAVLAMFHDSFILVGSFSVLGHFLATEVDFLFVTALLTTLSFSVHDTIVVFDRIREVNQKEKSNFYEVANRALTETMVRSLNNSFTIIFMLVALSLLGGITVRWFAVALLIGTVMGTYSSPFVAVPLLVTWDKLASQKPITN